ncbi:MAG: type II CAAX prenyl endopeptidase Rce1 family protein, partial [Candidatus Hodarchaeota archaeon]
MPFQFCPYCEKKTPIKLYCIHCGYELSNTTICQYCHKTIPINTYSCPFCRHNYPSSVLNKMLKGSSRLNLFFINFRLAILVIFLLSGYSLTQIFIGSFFQFIFTSIFFIDSIDSVLLSLIALLVSNTLLITIMLKWKPFIYQETPLKRSQFSLIFLLFLILIASISVIEVIVAFIDFGLDFIKINPSLSSPYDEFFNTPLNILTFTILITIFGPIFEELFFRRYTISVMLNQCESKFLAICTSALIFSLSHTATNVITSVRYAILHLFATFIIGIILGIIFLRWGLNQAILFHSLWNVYSLTVQLLINNGANKLVDLMFLSFILITIILIIYLFFRFRTLISSSNIPRINLPSRTVSRLISINLIAIITYELILPLILLSTPPSILTVGLTLLY